MMHRSALVLFSGGQDSTTCLAHALARYERVETLAFDYRQRHIVELQARLTVLRELKAQFPHWAHKLGQDHLLDLGVLGSVSETSLTRDMAFQMEASGLPNTFVPGRNLLFLTLAAALASEDQRVAGVVTFLIAASGVGFLGVGAAFWALLAGLVVRRMLRAPAAGPASRD